MAAVTYDPEADVLYVELSHAKDPENEGEEVHPGVVLMFDTVGKLIGIEIRPASKLVAGDAVVGLSYPARSTIS
ncbi:MAG: DUF2283 domain-containing protein [Alphaproteobacteria bacterium]|nr:MAG: DUF2283 domain-containing protein [Alphaproteobacteria bacterium]